MLENTDAELTGIDAPITYHPMCDSRPEFVEYVRVFDELFESNVLLVDSEAYFLTMGSFAMGAALCSGCS